MGSCISTAAEGQRRRSGHGGREARREGNGNEKRYLFVADVLEPATCPERSPSSPWKAAGLPAIWPSDSRRLTLYGKTKERLID
ncbi:unnamed protein product [Linum trigynum]|uniref:Uncharacterized protein n=1 Tax=Linum trigynum TaxID=586398 RepID=A0AAV2FHA3_9ROSI